MSELTKQPNLGRTIFKNTAFVTLGSVALKTINFLFGVYVIRRLGDDRFGQYSAVLAFVGLFQIFAELGMSQYVMREIAEDRRKTPSLFWNLVLVRAMLALLAMVGITAAAKAASYAPEMVLGVLIYTATFVLSAIEAPLETVLTANERFDYVTSMTILGQISFAVFGAGFLFGGLGFVWLIVASLLSLLPKIILGVWAVRRNHLLDFPVEIRPQEWPQLVRAGLPFGIISLALTIAYSIDTVMLRMFHPDNVVGWYNAAYSLTLSITFLSKGFKDAIVPTLTRTYSEEPHQVDRWYFRTVKVLILISLPLAVGGMIVAYPLIRFLYTDEFLPSALALQILIWDLPFVMFASFCGNMTTIVKEERSAAKIYTINALANIVLNFIFIPRYGFVAASVVTVVTDLIGAVQFYALLHGKLNLPDLRSIMFRTILAAAGMGFVVWMARSQHLFVMIALGVVVYGVLVLVLRLLDQTEWALISRGLQKLGLGWMLRHTPVQ